ncbi:MAG: two-component system LytT family response regulator [Saprospiraceae bacterium]|jgi:two-component system LytT family response regulator
MQVVKNIRTDIEMTRFENNISLLKNSLSYESSNSDRKIALSTMEGINFERIQNIISLEAKGNYTMLFFTGKRKLLVCKTLRDMENQLHTGSQFVRIHRSYTINLNYLQKYVKGKGGYVILENGIMINVSSGKKQGFLDALKIYFG